MLIQTLTRVAPNGSYFGVSKLARWQPPASTSTTHPSRDSEFVSVLRSLFVYVPTRTGTTTDMRIIPELGL